MSGPYTTIIQSSHMMDLSRHSHVFNLHNFADIVCVKLPDDFPRDFEMVGLYNLETDKDIDFEDYVEQIMYRPWVDFKKSVLDTSIGQHVYRMDFMKAGFNIGASCWFSYIIQDNNPEKPYVYMNREDPDPSGSSSED